jgi:hypothetical protein
MRWKARLLGSLAVSIAATLAPPAARSVTINQPIANSQVVSTASAPSTTSEPNYVVSVGRLIAGAGSERNWVRLAYYHLLPDGTVTEGFWYYAFPTQRGKTALPGTVCIADCIQYVPPGFETGAVAKALAGTYSVDPVTGVINIKWKTRVPSSESWNPMPARTAMSEFNLKANSDGATLGHAFGSSRAPSYRGAHIGHVFDYMTKNHSDLNLNGYLRQWKAGPQTFAVDTKVYTFELATSKRCSEYCFARATNRAHYYYRTPDPNGPLARNRTRGMGQR